MFQAGKMRRDLQCYGRRGDKEKRSGRCMHFTCTPASALTNDFFALSNVHRLCRGGKRAGWSIPVQLLSMSTFVQYHAPILEFDVVCSVSEGEQR